MNERMEQEIRRTIRFLQASMPEPKNRQTSVFTLLRIAASEINAWLLLGLFVGALSFGLVSVRVLSMPMLTIFCTAPMPMLLLFHRYVLACDQRMRELEATFPYSYSGNAGRAVGRDLVLHVRRAGAPFPRCCTLPSERISCVWRSAGLYRAFISVRCFCFCLLRSAIRRDCPCLRSSSGRRSAFWRRCFRLTGFCSSAPRLPTLCWRPSG